MTRPGTRAALLDMIGEAMRNESKIVSGLAAGDIDTSMHWRNPTGPHKGFGMVGAAAAVRSLDYPTMTAIAKAFGVTLPSVCINLKAARERGLLTIAEQSACFAKARFRHLGNTNPTTNEKGTDNL